MLQKFLILSLVFLPGTLHPMKQLSTYLSKIFSTVGARAHSREDSSHSSRASSQPATIYAFSETILPKVCECTASLSQQLPKIDIDVLVPQKLERRTCFKSNKPLIMKKNDPYAPENIPTINIYLLPTETFKKHINFKRPPKIYFKK